MVLTVGNGEVLHASPITNNIWGLAAVELQYFNHGSFSVRTKPENLDHNITNMMA